MLGCYRVGDAHDPETYISAVVAVLEIYPVETIQAVTNPVSGVASKIKWLPSIAEIKEACDALGPSWSVRYAEEWDARAARQLAERRPLLLEDSRPRKTYEQLQAELAEVGIFIGTDGKRPKAFDINGFREKHGITKEQWDAIPNAPGKPHA